jgi:hypothetical protein
VRGWIARKKMTGRDTFRAEDPTHAADDHNRFQKALPCFLRRIEGRVGELLALVARRRKPSAPFDYLFDGKSEPQFVDYALGTRIEGDLEVFEPGSDHKRGKLIIDRMYLCVAGPRDVELRVDQAVEDCRKVLAVSRLAEELSVHEPESARAPSANVRLQLPLDP